MKMQAQTPPEPGQLTLGLVYILPEGQGPCLARIERSLAGRELESVSDVPETLPSIKGLQFLLARTYLARLAGPSAKPSFNSPESIIIPLHSSIRNPDPVIWRDSIFPHHPNDVYLSLKYGVKKVSCTADLQIQIFIEEEGQGSLPQRTRKPTGQEIEDILERLKGKLEHPLDLNVKVIDHAGSNSWRIEGNANDRSLTYGDRVQIKAFFKKEKPLIFWMSNDEIFNIYPETDEELGNIGSPGITRTDKGHDLTIPQNTGFVIDTKIGIECCLAIGNIDAGISLSELRSAIFSFFRKNPITLLQPDIRPTKRFFFGKKKKIRRRGLGAAPIGREWEKNMLDEILPENSIAVMVSMPVKP